MAPQFSDTDERLDQLAEEFAELFRRGERPPIQEYVDRYPKLAAEIRELFTALVEIEGAQAAAVPTAAPPLRQIGDYRIVREIGHGGMGVVYEAEQASLGRRVALKVLAEHIGRTANGAERFRREARAAARLHHTNIVPVFEVGQSDGNFFYVMQFIPGQSLAQVIVELRRLRQPNVDRQKAIPAGLPDPTNRGHSLAESMMTGRYIVDDAGVRYEPVASADKAAHTSELAAPVAAVLPGQTDLSSAHSDSRHYFEGVARIGQQVAAALAHAHGRGIVHRDVKPSNLLLDAMGVVWVTDFGLAKTDDECLTETGALLGTFRYMAPERFRGQCDARADVYALGLTLYELLVLRPAFDSSDRAQLVRLVQEKEPPRPRAIDPRVPRDLETIVVKAMAKEPGRRYQTAGDLAADLRRFLAGEPVKARPVGRAARLWRSCRRHPGVASLAAALVLVLVGGTAAALVSALEYREMAKSESDARQVAQDANAAQKEAGNALRASLSRQYVGNGARALEAGDHALAMVWFAEALALDAGDPAREPAHRLRLANTWRLTPRLVGLYRHDMPLTCADITPDGTRVVTASYDGTARIWDVATGELAVPPLKLGGFVFAAVFSPDGTRVATACGAGTARLWDTATGEPRSPPLLHQRAVMSVAFSPDGRKLAAGCGGPSSFLTPPAGVSFSDPKGVLADWRNDKPWAAVWDLESGVPVRLSAPESSGVVAFSFSADGKRLALANLETTKSCIVDPATGKMTAGPFSQTNPDHYGDLVVSVALSPDGTRLLTETFGGKWKQGDPARNERLAERMPGKRPYFSADGQRLIGNGIWDAKTGKPLRLGLAGAGSPAAALVGPKQNLVLAYANDGVRLWDADSMQALSPTLRAPTRHELRAFGMGAPLACQGRFVLCGRGEHAARLWDLAGQAPDLPPVGAESSVARYSADGKRLVTAGVNGSGQVWDTASGRSVTAPFKHGAVIYDAGFSPDGRLVVTAGADGAARIWDAATGAAVGPPLKQEGAGEPGVWVARFDPSGERLITEFRHLQENSYLCVWNVRTGQRLWWTEKIDWRVYLAVSTSGKWLATGSAYGVVRLRDLATGQPIGVELKHAYWVGEPAFSPDDKYLLTCCGDQMARIWEVPGGRLSASIRCENGVVCGAFSPDGRRIVLGENGGNVSIADPATGRLLTPLLKHGGSVAMVAFSPDGRWVLSGGWDGLVRAWDAATGDPLGPPWHTIKPVQQAAFRADGSQVSVHGWRMPALLCDFTVDDRAPTAWRLLAEAQAGCRLAAGAVTPLTDAEFSARWDELRRQAPGDTTVPPNRADSWRAMAASGWLAPGSP